jgi:peptidoglycan/xylan/chitin deacetylase (PgdA/CDA1 family)
MMSKSTEPGAILVSAEQTVAAKQGDRNCGTSILLGNGTMIDDRDYVGYGAEPPDPRWPGGALIAVNINLNFEGGGERSVMDGDGCSEGLLNDIGFPSLPRLRSPMVEGVFEYGSRVGGWRLLRLFRNYGIKVSVLAVAKAAERNPELTRAFVEDGHEIVSHGYRWLDYQTMPEEVERQHVRLGIETLERVAGVRPVGWMTGRPSANTRRLHLELGGFLYDRDALNDELPYWIMLGGARHLSPILLRPTTTASTRTWVFRPARISLAI